MLQNEKSIGDHVNFELQDTMIEEREDFMVSPNSDGKNPIFREAHFLKPSLTSIDEQKSKISSDLVGSAKCTYKPRNGGLTVNFNGWRNPQVCWEKWVEDLRSTYQSVWRKTGIYEAIMSSTYIIKKDNDLVYGFASKWCCDTNSFVFPWGEATISLEDIMILGGYPVLGDSVLSDLETGEMKDIEESLLDERTQVVRTKAKKACQSGWMRHFMEDKRKFEHEAFLSLWLSRFVFPNSYDTIGKHVFPIAIRLARGIRVALAPAILACIYRDLRLLKKAIVDSRSLGGVVELTLWSPFHLVQIWIWERFVTLGPEPDLIDHNRPRLSRWHLKTTPEDVSLAFDSLKDFFQWRPYAMMLKNWVFPKFYREMETWVKVDSYLNTEIESFARCIRVGELVGIDCVEQYLPHRVAMQFGFDQDLPGHVVRSNERSQNDWINYDRKLVPHTSLYIPARDYESRVTVRYSKWWRESVFCHTEQQSMLKRKRNNDTSVPPPGFPSKSKHNTTMISGGPSNDDPITVDKTFTLKKSQDQKTIDDNILVSPECSSNNQPTNSLDEDQFTLSQLFNIRKNVKSTDFNAQIQILSSSEESEADAKSEFSTAQGKETTSNEAATGGLERVIELECSNINTFKSACRNGDVKTNGFSTFEKPDLEARMRMLERGLAELKGKFGCNHGTSSKKGRPSSHL